MNFTIKWFMFPWLVFVIFLISFSDNQQPPPSTTTTEETIKNFEDEWDYDEVDTVANSIIDDMLVSLKATEQLEPYYLHEDYEMDMVETFLLPFDPCWKSCKMKLVNGSLYGFSNLSRYDNVVMTNDGDDIIVQVRLQCYNVTVQGILSINLIGMHIPDAPFRNYLDYQIQYLDVAVGPHNKVRLRELRVERLEGVRMELTRFQDSKILRQFSDMITKKLVSSMQNQMTEVATKLFFPILANEFQYLGKRNETN